MDFALAHIIQPLQNVHIVRRHVVYVARVLLQIPPLVPLLQQLVQHRRQVRQQQRRQQGLVKNKSKYCFNINFQ
uniref:Uncharacterized protein n=1 Tax=Acrobeloides nanus TaxID=290746 RepID=A0A914DEK1_9BILA